MTSTSELTAVGDAHNSTSYSTGLPVLVRGEGARVWDRDGNEYLDFVAGIAVNALGHNHPKLVAAITQQAARLIHVSNMYYTEPQIGLLADLTSGSFADRVFLCNSGAEANEAAIKLARRYQHVVRGDKERSNFVTMKHSFHGRTLAAVTATGQPKYHKGFEPLVPGFAYADFNDLESVRALVDSRTAAVIVEPVQGEGGVRPADDAFLRGVREICDAAGALLIFDEVQTGIGRTGTLFAYEGYGVVPDIMTLAKGLGGGIPIGACLGTDEVFKGFEKGSHASTFGGNPLACAAARVVMAEVTTSGLLANVVEQGGALREGLRRVAGANPDLVEVRGRGLMLGVECAAGTAADLVTACRDQGLLVNLAGPDTVRFVPPLMISAQDVASAVQRFEAAVVKWSARRAA